MCLPNSFSIFSEVGNSHNKIPDASLPEAEKVIETLGGYPQTSPPVEGFFRYLEAKITKPGEEASEKCLPMAPPVRF